MSRADVLAFEEWAGFPDAPGDILAAMLADSPDYLWPFDEAAGTTADEVVADVDGTYTNTEDLTLGVAGPTPGTNLGVHIIGSGAGDGAVLLPSPVGAILAGQEFSMELWFRPTVAASGYSLISCVTADGWAQPFQMTLQAGETIRVRYGSASWSEDIVFNGAIPLVMNEWNQIVWAAGYVDPTTEPADCYVNGQVGVQINGATETRAFAARPTYVGARNATIGQGASTGDYALCAFWSVQLTPTQVMNHYVGFVP